VKDEGFWDWFHDNADAIVANYDDEKLIEQLDTKVAMAWPKLSWEMGPDISGDWYFALSPNLDKRNSEIATKAINSAPNIQGWVFYDTRQRKSWSGCFELLTGRGTVKIDSSTWEYVLLRYPDGECEIFLIGDEANLFDEDERWKAAAIVVEGLLGEKIILDNDLSFTLSNAPEPQFRGRQKPIQDLPRAFGFE